MRDLSVKEISMRDLSASCRSASGDDSDSSLKEVAASTRLDKKSNARAQRTHRKLGQKPSFTEGDGLFLIVDEATTGSPHWPNFPFFNFSKRNLTDKDGDN